MQGFEAKPRALAVAHVVSLAKSGTSPAMGAAQAIGTGFCGLQDVAQL